MLDDIPRSWGFWVMVFVGAVLYPFDSEVSKGIWAGGLIGITFSLFLNFVHYARRGNYINKKFMSGELNDEYKITNYNDIGWGGILWVALYMLGIDINEEYILIRNMYTEELKN